MRHQREFRVTMFDHASLLQRLVKELRFLFYQLRLAWPDLKRDPVGFSRRTILDGWSQLKRAATTNSLAALATAMFLVFSAGLILLLISNRSRTDQRIRDHGEELVQITELLPTPEAPKEGHGVGAGAKGRVGFRNDKGEGSGPEPKNATGGGGGGNGDPLPAQVGKLPPPSEIPAPIPKFPPVQTQALAVAGIDIDPALWKDLPASVYGDPRSKSATPSNGPGDLGGMGPGNGQGVGEGNRNGVGPGSDGNMGGGPKGAPGCCGDGGSNGSNPDDPDRVYPPPQVTERARVLAKPEPQFTEEARRNAITGTVVLRVVFSRTGEVTNIRAVQPLPFGLTERAIAAARMIKFRPATRDGRPVSVYMQLEYNFNLY